MDQGAWCPQGCKELNTTEVTWHSLAFKAVQVYPMRNEKKKKKAAKSYLPPQIQSSFSFCTKLSKGLSIIFTSHLTLFPFLFLPSFPLSLSLPSLLLSFFYFSLYSLQYQSVFISLLLKFFQFNLLFPVSGNQTSSCPLPQSQGAGVRSVFRLLSNTTIFSELRFYF